MAIDQPHSSNGRFPLRWFAAAFVISMLAGIFSGWQLWKMHIRFDEISAKHIDIAKDVGRIMLLDEVLTMSARMAAATGDLTYEKRYDQFDPELTALINKVRADLPQAEMAPFVAETDAANLALVSLERQAFALTHQGRRQEASALLTSAEYLRLKKIYAGGMEKTVTAANRLREKDSRNLDFLSFWLGVASAMSVLVLLAAWFFASRSARRWAAERGEFEEALQKSRDELEDKVIQRTAALSSANEQLQQEIAERKQAEAALRQSEIRYQALVSNANDAIICLSPNSLIYLWNDRAEKMFGYTAAEAIGRDLRELIYPERDLQAVAQGMRQFALSPANAVVIEVTTRRKDNSEFPVEISIAKMPIGGEVHSVGIVRDITERKRAEASLRESEEKFRAIFDHSRDGILVMQIDGHFVKFANAIMEQMLGYGPGELNGLPFSRLHPPESFAQIRELFDKARGGGIETVPDMPMQTKDGRVVYMDLRGAPVSFGGQHYMLGAFRDATERRAAQEQLRFNAQLLDSVADSIIASDMDSNIVYLNESAWKTRGYTREEMMAMNIHTLDLPEYAKLVGDRIAGMMRTGSAVFESAHRRKDGSVMPIEVSARLIELAGRKLVISTSRDITERKKAEVALREGEQRLKFHMENSPMAVVEWDADFIVTRWSGQAEIIFGWSQAETVGKPIMDLKMIYEEDIPIVENVMRQLTAGTSRYVVSTNRNYTKDGKVIVCEWYNSILHDSQGKMVSVFSQVLDITERKRAEVSLTEQLDELHRWHTATSGREKRILELKHEVNELLGQNGQPPRYPSAE